MGRLHRETPREIHESYRDVLMQDCLRANYETTQGSFFQRLMLPLGGYVISAVDHHFTKFDANLGYPEITSYFDVWSNFSDRAARQGTVIGR